MIRTAAPRLGCFALPIVAIGIWAGIGIAISHLCKGFGL